MDARINHLAATLDAKARRAQRELNDVRRLAAQIRDATTTQDTPATEDTDAEDQQAREA